MNWRRNRKKRIHDDAVNASELAIRSNIERQPDPGQRGWKIRTEPEWVSLMPELPDSRVAGEVFRRLGAKIITETEDGRVHMLIDIRECPPSRRAS